MKACVTDYNDIVLFNVKEVQSQSCYGGTQIFYLVTGIQIKNTNDGTVIKSGGGIDRNNANVVPGTNMVKFREDELEKISLKKLIIEIDKIKDVKK